ncbi:MAG: hypothetical protein ACRD2R_05365, partial [Terriglobales bacterium]
GGNVPAVSALLRNLPDITPSELGRPRLRMRNPIMAGSLEGITQPLYDIYRVAVATVLPNLRLFSIPVGGIYNFGGIAAFNKGEIHTNLVQAGVLEAPNKHIVRAISVYVGGQPQAAPQIVNAVDLVNFLQSTLMDFQVNQKSYCKSIVGRFPAGGGPFSGGGVATTVAATTNNSSVLANGWPDTRNTYGLAYGGVPIEQQQNFTVLLNPTQEAGGAFTTVAAVAAAGNLFIAGTGLGVIVFLDGTLFRAVQ